jgi:hypothetical protein
LGNLGATAGPSITLGNLRSLGVRSLGLLTTLSLRVRRWNHLARPIAKLENVDDLAAILADSVLSLLKTGMQSGLPDLQ